MLLTKIIKRVKSELYWPNAIYSIGYCYRLMSYWPTILPIPCFSDHGIDLRHELDDYEINNTAQLHLTWSRHRYDHNKYKNSKEMMHILHPFVYYRRLKKIKKIDNARGTLVFFPHSNEEIDLEFESLEHYIKQLETLGEEYKPLVFCMHFHDINKGYHKLELLRKYTVLTAGELHTDKFVSNFYSIIRQFRYATSCTGGSELFLCQEIGVNYFLYGDRVRFHSATRKLGPFQESLPVSEEESMKRDLFFSNPDVNLEEKYKFIEDILGLKCTHTRFELTIVFALQYLKIAKFHLFNVLRISRG